MRVARNNLVNGSVVCSSPNNNLIAPYINGIAPSGYSIAASSTATTGGSLAANPWAYVISTKGVTGESPKNYQSTMNEVLLTSTGSTSVNTLNWNSIGVPDGNGFRIWRGSAGTGSENQYTDVSSSTSKLVDDGTLSWISGTMPTTQGAVSADRFHCGWNACQDSTLPVDPSGSTVTIDGAGSYATSGLLNTTTGLLVTSNGGKIGVQLS